MAAATSIKQLTQQHIDEIRASTKDAWIEKHIKKLKDLIEKYILDADYYDSKLNGINYKIPISKQQEDYLQDFRASLKDYFPDLAVTITIEKNRRFWFCSRPTSSFEIIILWY